MSITKSPLQVARQSYQPKIPVALMGNVHIAEGEATQSVANQEDIKKLFPNTYGMPVLTIEAATGELARVETFNIGIILSGGQAPGGHNVISGLYDGLKKLNPENKLYGFLGGPIGLVEHKYALLTSDTIDEYRKTIEKDGALERRFQKVMVEPTSAADTLEILKNIRDRYEEHHNVRFTDDAIQACVALTDRYVTDRNFPDKAIDALDEAGSRMHLYSADTPEIFAELEQKIEDVKKRKDAAIISQSFEEAAACRDEQRSLEHQLKEERDKWNTEQKNNRPEVNAEIIAECVAKITGIPVQKVAASEGQKLLALKGILQSSVIGQDNAIEKVVRAIQRNRIGLKDPQKPIGTFLFLGPTGVGKTYLAKRLAEEMFSAKDSLIRIDMSEYMEKYSVSRLIGAPPGYVGYDEGGQLTERVRRHPYSVILFDEIEKAHPDVFNLMLQIFDEGHLTDSLGRKVSFKNTIIILTSNIGSRQLKEFGNGIGFASRSDEQENALARGVITKALQKTFSPEFINRIDDIIHFGELSEEDIRQVVLLQVGRIHKMLEQNNIDLRVTDDAVDYIAKEGYDPAFGARPVKRALQRLVLNELSKAIIAGKVDGTRPVIVELKDGELRFKN